MHLSPGRPLESTTVELMLYRLATILWGSTLADHKSKIERIAFDLIPTLPELRLNRALHLERRGLVNLIDHVDEFIRSIPSNLNNGVDGGSDGAKVLEIAAHGILKEARELDKFLMDTFQLLMSTITVMAAEAGLKETRSAQKLLWLASIYLPLTLTTSIFGMNISFINDSPAPWWSLIVALAATAIFTVATLKIFEASERGRRALGATRTCPKGHA